MLKVRNDGNYITTNTHFLFSLDFNGRIKVLRSKSFIAWEAKSFVRNISGVKEPDGMRPRDDDNHFGIKGSVGFNRHSFVFLF